MLFAGLLFDLILSFGAAAQTTDDNGLEVRLKPRGRGFESAKKVFKLDVAQEGYEGGQGFLSGQGVFVENKNGRRD